MLHRTFALAVLAGGLVIAVTLTVNHGKEFSAIAAVPRIAMASFAGGSHAAAKSIQPALHSGYVTGTIVGLNFAPIGSPQSFLWLRRMWLRVDRNGGSQVENPDPNLPFRVGEVIAVKFTKPIPPGIITPRVGDMVGVGYTADASAFMAKTPVVTGEWDKYVGGLSWIWLTEPVSGQVVRPGERLHIAGFVPDPSLWGKFVHIDLLAGFLKVSNPWMQAQIQIGKDGVVEADVQLPAGRLPHLHGRAITLEMQPELRQGPTARWLLLPGQG
ncbi:hypothetical protein GCM10010885_06930 [Alicyclobacillus cellulosilyticus]|uniref:Uncharacterized protein n=1 Tax=Alicyclobacillus cellulosilyticus TaxID=1003997 RepID=A0A917K706_9BACL|nr:hypothetical protein [Alicyclobacillus cellulosilyticus]GGJ00299.1 hypothetical protein GCM10010885_06930 [Alicyclobacillus cellulosilyticus]